MSEITGLVVGTLLKWPATMRAGAVMVVVLLLAARVVFALRGRGAETARKTRLHDRAWTGQA
jgi:hypothetical protein